MSIKFKEGDTVYLKAVFLKNDEGPCLPNKIKLAASEMYYIKDEDLMTKQEMLEELQKPEIPKVGETWFYDKNETKIVMVVCATERQVAYQYFNDKQIAVRGFSDFMNWFTKE